MDLADDIALVSEEINEAQEMLTRVEKSAKLVGLRMNIAKTKYISTTIPINSLKYKLLLLKIVEDFKYT